MVKLSEEAKQLMETMYDADIKIVQEEYFSDSTLIEIKQALEFASNQIDQDGVDAFLCGIKYQKKRR